MKKTLKKLISLTLVFLLVFSAFSVQASAGLFDKIESVEIADGAAVTARELEYYIEVMDEYGWESEEDYLYYHYPEMIVTLSDGTVIETEEYGYGETGKRNIDMNSYVDVRDYLEAKEKGYDTIPLYYEMTLYSSIYVEMDVAVGVAEIDIIECYVKSITPVSALPDTYRDNGTIGIILGNYLPEMEEFDIEGAEFDIEYPDGSVERATVELVTDNDGYEYYELNGEEIWYYFDDEESALVINYYDVIYEHPVEFIPFPVTEIVIDEVTVTDVFEAESVSYTVTKPDGTTQSYTYTFDGAPVTTILGMDCYMAESVDGAYIVILVSKEYTDDYPSTEIMDFVVFADIDTYATESVEGATQEDNLLNRIIYKLRMFFIRILAFFWYI